MSAISTCIICTLLTKNLCLKVVCKMCEHYFSLNCCLFLDIFPHLLIQRILKSTQHFGSFSASIKIIDEGKCSRVCIILMTRLHQEPKTLELSKGTPSQKEGWGGCLDCPVTILLCFTLPEHFSFVLKLCMSDETLLMQVWPLLCCRAVQETYKKKVKSEENSIAVSNNVLRFLYHKCLFPLLQKPQHVAHPEEK